MLNNIKDHNNILECKTEIFYISNMCTKCRNRCIEYLQANSTLKKRLYEIRKSKAKISAS